MNSGRLFQRLKVLPETYDKKKREKDQEDGKENTVCLFIMYFVQCAFLAIAPHQHNDECEYENGHEYQPACCEHRSKIIHSAEILCDLAIMRALAFDNLAG
jgi:hypothetical protein